MPTFAIIWVALILAFTAFAAYFMYNKQKKANTDIDITLERQKATTYKADLENGKYSFLKRWMNGLPMDAFTSAGLSLTASDKAKGYAKDAAKSVAWAAVGVRARYQRVETPCYLVLSNNEVHFFTTDVDGEKDQHIVFNAEELQQAGIQHDGIKKGQAGAPNRYSITFNDGDKPLTIYAFNKLVPQPNVKDFFNKNYFNDLVKSHVVGEIFLKQLGDKYSNLRVNIN